MSPITAEARARMATIRTTAIVPSDLNALLFGLENAIADGAAAAGIELAELLQRIVIEAPQGHSALRAQLRAAASSL